MHRIASIVAALLLAAGPRASAGPLSEAEARAALAALEGPSRAAAESALERIVAAKDARFASVLVELMRASDLGLAAPSVGAEAARALERLGGEDLGADWPAWVRWYAGTALTPPPGFLGFKGRLLGRIDPAFEELLRDEVPIRIRAEEIVWGGVAFEGIPALDRPRVVSAAEATWLEPDEPVFGIRLGSEARAYPLRILDWHELANDELGGIPFALTWCTLCGSGIAYEARVEGSGTLRFGSSGLLLRSNKLMVDRGTRTLWSQLDGRAVLGPLAAGESRLRVLPSVVTRWRDWRARHPATTVISLDTGHPRHYEPGAAYAGYFAAPSTMFPVRRERGELPEKERVFGMEREGVSRAWPLSLLVERGILNDDLAAEPLVLVTSGSRIFVDGVGERDGPARYEAGAAVRAFSRGPNRFRAGDRDGEILDHRDRTWRVEEEALVGPEGERLPRVAGALAYWFAWQAFHPRTELWSGEPRPAR